MQTCRLSFAPLTWMLCPWRIHENSSWSCRHWPRSRKDPRWCCRWPASSRCWHNQFFCGVSLFCTFFTLVVFQLSQASLQASQASQPSKQASKQGSSSNSNSNTKSNSKGYNKSNSSKLTRHGSCDSKRRAVAIVIVHNSTRNSQVLVMATRM